MGELQELNDSSSISHSNLKSCETLSLSKLVSVVLAENLKVTLPGEIRSPEDRECPFASLADSMRTVGNTEGQSLSSAPSINPSESSSAPLSQISTAGAMQSSSSIVTSPSSSTVFPQVSAGATTQSSSSIVPSPSSST